MESVGQVGLEGGLVRTFALAAVLIVDSGLLVAVIVWPWLIAAGVAAVMRLGLAGAVNDRDIDEVVDAAVRTGMPDLLARWLRPRVRPPSRPRWPYGGNTQEMR